MSTVVAPSAPRSARGTGGIATSGHDAVGMGETASAAPFAIAFFGSASTATGRASPSDTSCATSGIRDEPPTSSTAESSPGLHPAERTAVRSASTVSSTCGRIIDSNSLRCSRTEPPPAGRSTGIDTSVSADSASLASVHSRRTRATADSTPVSVSSRSLNAAGRPVADVVEHDVVEVDAAQPVEALRPAEQPEPGGAERGLGAVGLAHDGGVERAAAQVVDRDGGAGRDPLLRGVVQRGGLRLGEAA